MLTPKGRRRGRLQMSTHCIINRVCLLITRTNDQQEEKKQHEETFINDKDPAFLFSIGELTSDHLI